MNAPGPTTKKLFNESGETDFIMPKKLVDALEPNAVLTLAPGRYVDGAGLHLLVRASGRRSWVYRFMLRGKSRDLGLGPAGKDGISLVAARAARDALREKVQASAPNIPSGSSGVR